MNTSLLAILTGIFIFYLVLPADFYLLTEFLILTGRLVALNYYLMLRAWLLYRLICRDLARIGMPRPAFKFTPLWER